MFSFDVECWTFDVRCSFLKMGLISNCRKHSQNFWDELLALRSNLLATIGKLPGLFEKLHIEEVTYEKLCKSYD